ncbi:MAG: hypothetical protein M3Y71_19575 [Actinomycetota bacterium]|nr:hypothetical protein [Actinomycetota bacterium]
MGHDENQQQDDDVVTTRATEHYDDDKEQRPAAGHTWGPAVTSLIGPTDETVGAVDTDEPRIVAHQAVEEQIEAAIVAVAKTHGGTHSREIVRDALRRELEQRGRWPQPEPWLDAVASELEVGGVYNMGTDPTDLERRTDPDDRPAAEGD